MSFLSFFFSLHGTNSLFGDCSRLSTLIKICAHFGGVSLSIFLLLFLEIIPYSFLLSFAFFHSGPITDIAHRQSDSLTFPKTKRKYSLLRHSTFLHSWITLCFIFPTCRDNVCRCMAHTSPF